MSDSPMVRIPLDPKEQPILDSLLSIRHQLELMKQDKSCFVKSDDVLRLYGETIVQVHSLNNIRIEKREEQNRVDTVLDDCFQLISLAFMTIGKNTEAPAIYSVVSTIKRLLDHLKEAAFYSAKDLEMILQHLQTYRSTIEKCRTSHDPNIVTLLEARIGICESVVAELQQRIRPLTPDLMTLYEKLVSILRSLSACNVKSKFPKDELDSLRAQLKDIQNKLQQTGVSGSAEDLAEEYTDKLKQVIEQTSDDPTQLVADLLARCLIWVEVIEQRPGRIGEGFREIFEKLLDIRNGLESRFLLQAWSMRETDLYSLQRQLDRIDDARTPEGNFTDELGQSADIQTQRTLLYLLRKSYALIYLLLTSSQPVSEALLPTYNQLKTLRKCLKEVQKAGGVSSMRELYPYKMKLNSIDRLRVDGKFMVNNNIPDGQAAVMQLLEDCYEVMHALQTELEQLENSDAQEDGISSAPEQITA